jgi:hypothetical protein
MGRKGCFKKFSNPSRLFLGDCFFFGTVFEKREKLLEKMAYLTNEQ